MEIDQASLNALGMIRSLLATREEQYDRAVQTSVYGKNGPAWQNFLTTIHFACKGQDNPPEVRYEYPETAIVRRALTPENALSFLSQTVKESRLETGHKSAELSVNVRFSSAGSGRQSHPEWSRWPADVFLFDPVMGQNYAPNTPLIAVEAPYYPSFSQLLSEFFDIRNQSWTNYFRGQIVAVLPDFRARISKFIIGQGCLRAEIDGRFSEVSDLVAKIYAASSASRLCQEMIRLEEPAFRVDLADTPTMASVVVMCGKTHDVLDQRTFQQNTTWQDPGVSIEQPEQEIEQMILTGECETLEFKLKLSRSERLVKTAVAFANTKGGTIIFGVDDEHQVLGCEIRGMADTITNMIRGNCDPLPEFSTRIVEHQGKSLFLVDVIESSRVHVVRELGPFIRAQGTTRVPTADELAALFSRKDRRGLTNALFNFNYDNE